MKNKTPKRGNIIVMYQDVTRVINSNSNKYINLSSLHSLDNIMVNVLGSSPESSGFNSQSRDSDD